MSDVRQLITFSKIANSFCFVFLMFVSSHSFSVIVDITRYSFHSTGATSLVDQVAQIKVSGASAPILTGNSYGRLLPTAKMTMTPTLDESTSISHPYWSTLTPTSEERILTKELERHKIYDGKSKWYVIEDVAPSLDSPNAIPSRPIGEAWSAIENDEYLVSLITQGYFISKNEKASGDAASALPCLASLRISHIFGKLVNANDDLKKSTKHKYTKLKKIASSQLELWEKHPALDDVLGGAVLEMNLLFAKVPSLSRSASDLSLSGATEQSTTKHIKYFVGVEYKRKNAVTGGYEVVMDIVSGKEDLCTEIAVEKSITVLDPSEVMKQQVLERLKKTSGARWAQGGPEVPTLFPVGRSPVGTLKVSGKSSSSVTHEDGVGGSTLRVPPPVSRRPASAGMKSRLK